MIARLNADMSLKIRSEQCYKNVGNACWRPVQVTVIFRNALTHAQYLAKNVDSIVNVRV